MIYGGFVCIVIKAVIQSFYGIVLSIWKYDKGK
jgi:hypothetical protein